MPNLIGPNTWVEIHYTLRDGRGNLLESTEGPDAEGPLGFVWGLGAVTKGLEEALEGAIEGDVLDVTISPEDGYGTRDPDDVFEVERGEFPEPEKLEVGAEFSADGDDGTSITMRVLEVHPDHVLVDANHPLAGETLNYQVRVLKVRAATPDEILVAKVELTDPSGPDEIAS
ncbi:MAG: peptidylprolyl isomerase [Myxococcales bacterium]|nr:peptidylprolyl isomerase [Myxococcales bacterium]